MKFGFMLISFMILSGTAVAKVYKWVDENGVTHYSQKKPEQEVTEMKVKGISDKEEAQQESLNGKAQSSSDFDCRGTVIRGLKLVKANARKEFGADAAARVVEMLDDPAIIDEGEAACKKDMKRPKKAAEWRCQSRATTFAGLKACEEN